MTQSTHAQLPVLPTTGPLSWVSRQPFYQAGLAGYSDYAMRMIARRHGCPYCITEAMLDHFLLAGGKYLKAAELESGDHPICGQLMGSHPDEIAQGAKILHQLGYDVIDVNLACPVKKIKKKCRGGHLLSAPGEAIEILKAVADAVGSDRPMTVKLRRAYDDSLEAEQGFHKIMQAAIELGYSGVTIHGRTVQQKYLGPSKWPALKTIIDQYKHEAVRHTDATNQKFILGGSGDIWQARDIFDMIEQTGVDIVSVARGCIGNPWIFEQANMIQQGDHESATLGPTIFQQRDVLLEHFTLSVQVNGEHRAGAMMRKFGIRFSRHHPQGGDIKQAFIKVKTMSDWQAVLQLFYSTDGPGVDAIQAMPDEAKRAQDQSSEPLSVQ
ncbi:tRNA dihydrouridine synthase [Poriferisphaera sp. WC338]|uniref:tRNA dihydrouridine synthase n=1 Tax=Poriferisphaera sp. WC338 TaxID=3425129 RepID=UPI003D81BCA5